MIARDSVTSTEDNLIRSLRASRLQNVTKKDLPSFMQSTRSSRSRVAKEDDADSEDFSIHFKKRVRASSSALKTVRFSESSKPPIVSRRRHTDQVPVHVSSVKIHSNVHSNDRSISRARTVSSQCSTQQIASTSHTLVSNDSISIQHDQAMQLQQNFLSKLPQNLPQFHIDWKAMTGVAITSSIVSMGWFGSVAIVFVLIFGIIVGTCWLLWYFINGWVMMFNDLIRNLLIPKEQRSSVVELWDKHGMKLLWSVLFFIAFLVFGQRLYFIVDNSIKALAEFTELATWVGRWMALPARGLNYLHRISSFMDV